MSWLGIAGAAIGAAAVAAVLWNLRGSPRDDGESPEWQDLWAAADGPD